jgi:hypothetical protein
MKAIRPTKQKLQRSTDAVKWMPISISVTVKKRLVDKLGNLSASNGSEKHSVTAFIGYQFIFRGVLALKKNKLIF